MTPLDAYRRRSPCGRVAWAIRNACVQSRCGLLTRADMTKVLMGRFKRRTISRVLTTLQRVSGVRIWR
jgi:hypothetical protein